MANSGTRGIGQTRIGAGGGSGASAVSSITGDGTIITNSGSTGAVTLTTGTTTGSCNIVLATSPTLVTPALGTPSAINLSNATSLAAAALPTPTTTALGGLPRQTFMSSFSVATNSATGTAVAQNATKLCAFYLPFYAQISNIVYSLTTADNTANVYDIGIYGPGCLGGATSIPLACHTGPTAGTTLASGTGVKTLALSASNATLSPGWYAFAYTSSASSPAAVFGGGGGLVVTPFAAAAAPAGGTGTTSSGTLNSTITAPALSWTFTTNNIAVAGYV